MLGTTMHTITMLGYLASMEPVRNQASQAHISQQLNLLEPPRLAFDKFTFTS